jgi:ATP/ADP translocase
MRADDTGRRAAPSSVVLPAPPNRTVGVGSFLAFGLPVSKDEANRAVVLATIASGAMIAQQVAGKATRDALFLATYSVKKLPWMMGIGALVSFVAAVVGAWALAKYGPRRVVRIAFLLGTVAFAAEFAASFISHASLPIVVYLHIALFGAPLISLFWSLINERFDPHTAKHAIARIATGGTVGGVIGGLIGWQIAGITTVRATLAVLAAFNAISLVAVARVDGGSRPTEPSPSRPPPADPIGPASDGRLAAEKYLLGLATMVALIAAMEALIDWTFAASASATMTDGRSLLRFFSAFHAVVAVLAFLAQSLLSRRSLERVGLAGTLAMLPITVVAFGALAALVPRLVTAVLLRGAEMVMSNSLWRSGYEMLYTPIQQSKKRSTKTLVDVGSDRLGTLIGSAAISLLLAFSSRPLEVVAILAVGLGLVGIVVARSLHRGYVGALEESLRKGATEAAAKDPIANRSLDVPLDSLRVVTQPPAVRPSEDPVLREIVALRGGDRAATEKVLASEEPSPQLVPFVIPLLVRPELRKAAAAYLSRLAPRIVGQLVDALLDPQVPSLARRRIARLLRSADSQRVVEGLILGLADQRFEIRYECGIALVRVTEKDPSLVIPQKPILEAVQRELVIEREILEDEENEEEESDRPFCAVLRDRASRGLEHVFTILSLMLDRDPLRIAWRALNTSDDKLRGTALEYLENVLPPELRDALWPYLERERRPSQPPRRTREEIERDLTSAQGLIAAALSAIGGPRKSHA